MAERRDVHAAVEARRELGPAYEDEIVDSLLTKIDRKLEERRPRPPARLDLRLPLGSIALGVAATAVATSDAGGVGGAVIAVIAWIAIALVNLGYALRYR